MKYFIIMVSMLCITAAGTCLGFDQTICSPGSEIGFYPGGALKTCILRENFVINDITCNLASPLTLYANGKLRSCVTSKYYNYGSAITCNQLAEVTFFPSGKLASCELSKTIHIDGKTCDQLKPISLFENGQPKSCSKPQ